MSYILDALKKKETEHSEAVPDIKSQHYHSEFEDDSAVNWKWVGGVLAGLFLLVMMFVAYNYGKQTTTSDEPRLVEKSHPDTSVIANETNQEPKATAQEHSNKIETEQAVIKVESKPIELNSPVVEKVKPVVSKPVLKPQQPVVELDEAQATVAAVENSVTESFESVVSQSDRISNDFSALPSLRYSSHIYADDAKDRFVMLNGRALGIGQKLPNGVKVVDILEDDLVINYQGKTYQIPSLSDIE